MSDQSGVPQEVTFGDLKTALDGIDEWIEALQKILETEKHKFIKDILLTEGGITVEKPTIPAPKGCVDPVDPKTTFCNPKREDYSNPNFHDALIGIRTWLGACNRILAGRPEDEVI